MSRFKVGRFCACGGELVAESEDLETVTVVTNHFDRMHAGEGHGLVTRRQAARARRQAMLREAEDLGGGR